MDEDCCVAAVEFGEEGVEFRVAEVDAMVVGF